MNKKETKGWKKILIIVLLVVFAVSCCVCIWHFNSNKTDLLTKTYEKNKDDVDAGISEFMNSKKIITMDKESQINSMQQLLSLYENSGEITNLYYDENGKMYTFYYKDGTSGGVSFKEFDPYFN